MTKIINNIVTGHVLIWRKRLIVVALHFKIDVQTRWAYLRLYYYKGPTI